MSKLDTNHVVNLDLVKDRVNGVIKFGLADIETSDFFVGLYNNGSRVFDKDYIVTLYIVKPNGTFRNIKLEPKEGLKKYYCNLPDTLKNIVGEYVCQVMVFDNLTGEKKISKSKFKYSVSVDLASEMAGIIDEEEQESILTNILNRLLTLENPVEPYATQKHVDECVSTLTEEIDTIKVKDTEQDGRLVNIESKNTEQDGRLNVVETKNNEQDNRLDIIEVKDIEQDNRLVNIESKNTEQDEKLNTIESKDIEQDERLNSLENKVDGIDEKIVDTIEPTLVNHGNKLDALETKDIEHEQRMTNIETKNTEQDNRLNSLESKDLIHEQRITDIESKNIEQDERLSNIESKNTEQDNRLDAIEIKNQQQDDRLLDIEKVNNRQDIDIKCLYGASQTIDITKEGNSIYLQNSNNGFAIIDEIQGNTLVNCNKEPDKELILNGNINTQGYSNVTLTEGVDGGLVDVALEGNTMVNVCDQKDPVAITKSYTVETGNHVALQGEYDGKCRPVVTGNTLVNLINKNTNAWYVNKNADGYITNVFKRYTSEIGMYPNKTYTVILSEMADSGSGYVLFQYVNNIGTTKFISKELINNKYFTINITDIDAPLTSIVIYQKYNIQDGTVAPSQNSNFYILEGDYTNKPIPGYFEGLQSSFEDKVVTQEMVDNGEELAENLGKYKVDYVMSKEDGTVGQTKTFYLNSPLLEGDTIEQQGDNVVHVHRSEIRAYQTDDELTLPTDMTNTLVAKATPYYEVISQNDTILCDSYVNGHLDIDSVVPIEKVDFLSFEEDLTYLYANTQYTVQFVSNAVSKLDITLGGAKLLNQDVMVGINKYMITTPSELIDNNLVLNGEGFNASNIVVTEATDQDFGYFEGMKSVGECEDLEVVSSNSDNTLSNTQTLTHEPLRAVEDTKDKDVLIDGKWYIERNCYKKVLDGSEGWVTVNNTYARVLIKDLCPDGKMINGKVKIIADKLPVSNNLTSMEGIFMNDAFRIRIGDTMTGEQAKSYLRANPITVIYPLSTPQYEPIDYNPFTVYSDITHISNNSTIPCNMVIKNTGYNCLLKPSTTYTVSSNLGLNVVTTPSTLTEDCLRFYDTDTSDVTTMKNVMVLEGDYTTNGKPIPSHFSGIESAFEQEYDEAVGKYKVKVRVQNEDASKENYIEFYINEPLRGIGDTKDKVYVKNDKVVVERNCGQRVYQDGDFETYLTDKVNTVYPLAEPTYEEVEYHDVKLFIESFKNSTLFYNSNIPVTSKVHYSYSVPIVDTVAQTANISDQQDSMIIDLATQCAVMEIMLM